MSKVYFESLPGFIVTGNLYRPIGDGPYPAILSPHGHWAYGRLENSAIASVPGRAINLARQGFVVFTYDMAGYNDSQQIEHRLFGGPREKMWGFSVAGLQLWNGIRSLDFLESLPYVRRDAIGATGASGGGTQVFLLAAVDERVAVAAPVNMISLQMQGGCLCENQPGLRLDTNNVEIAATIAPRPLLMVSATGDWTTNAMQREHPAVRALYALRGAEDRVHGVQFDAPHNYNRESREAVYAWMARWLQNEPADVRREERPFAPSPLSDLLVFHQRPVPDNSVTAAQLTENWIEAAQRQLVSTPLETRARAAPLPRLQRVRPKSIHTCSNGTAAHGYRVRSRCVTREAASVCGLCREDDRLHAVRCGRGGEDSALRYLQQNCRQPARRRHCRRAASRPTPRSWRPATRRSRVCWLSQSSRDAWRSSMRADEASRAMTILSRSFTFPGCAGPAI